MKLGKDYYSELGAFRPISLMSFYFKAMEIILNWHLQDTCDKEIPLSNFQHAYFSERGTETALSSLIVCIEKRILRNAPALVVSVNIQGAFNILSTNSIVKAMMKFNYPALLVSWYEHFLNNRIACTNVLGILHEEHHR